MNYRDESLSDLRSGEGEANQLFGIEKKSPKKKEKINYFEKQVELSEPNFAFWEAIDKKNKETLRNLLRSSKKQDEASPEPKPKPQKKLKFTGQSFQPTNMEF